jgi:DNA sulfur modification protein DndC
MTAVTKPPPPADTSLAEKLRGIKADLRAEYLSVDARPWIIGFSGGKDSTLVLQLVVEMLLEMPRSEPSLPTCVRQSLHSYLV